MEMSLHRQLKAHYASGLRGEVQMEAPIDGYRIDVVGGGELIEIQAASLAAIRRKVGQLLTAHRVRVVKPLIAQKQLIRYASPGGKIQSHRRSPKRGEWIDLVHELIYFRGVFPHPGLTLEFPRVEVLEHRVARRSRRFRGRDYRVLDVELLSVGEAQVVRTPSDLLHLFGMFERFAPGVPSVDATDPAQPLPTLRTSRKPSVGRASSRVRASVRVRASSDDRAVPIVRAPSTACAAAAGVTSTSAGAAIAFDTQQLAEHLQQPRWIAQRLAYCLRHFGALETVGKLRRAWLYRIPAALLPQPSKTRTPASCHSSRGKKRPA